MVGGAAKSFTGGRRKEDHTGRIKVVENIKAFLVSRKQYLKFLPCDPPSSFLL
jgi:hypothetical protein